MAGIGAARPAAGASVAVVLGADGDADGETAGDEHDPAITARRQRRVSDHTMQSSYEVACET